jgi:hypothetical protein
VCVRGEDRADVSQHSDCIIRKRAVEQEYLLLRAAVQQPCTAALNCERHAWEGSKVGAGKYKAKKTLNVLDVILCHISFYYI